MVSGKLYIKDNSGNVQELKIDKERTVEFIRGTQTAAGAELTGVTEDSALYDGKTIFYYLPFAAASNATLNLTLSDETTTGAKPVFVTATTRLGTHYSAGSVISLTYLADKDGWYRSDYWNSNTYDRTYLNSPIKAATAVTAGTIIVGTASGYKMAASGVTFDLGYPILYASAAIAAAATNNATYLEIPNINLQTTKASWTGANNSIVYIVGTLSGNTVTIDSTVFTTTVPTSDDSKVYVPFGIMTSTTACYLMPMDGVYAFRNGSFGPLEPKVTVTGSGNAVTAITATNGVITATKGVTFATNGHTHTYPSLSVTTSGTGNVVDGLSVSNHAITLSKATTALLSATVSGTGNGITTASYANGVLTLTKGLTFSTNGHTHTETQLSLATSGTGNGIADLSVSNHTITMTKTSFTTGAHPTIPNLSISTSGTGNGISAISVSGHAITVTKAEFTTGVIPTIPAITVATSGSGDAIIGISATNHAITATKGGSWSPSSHGLSATSTGAGNAFDAITVSNHSITMGKTTTFATTHSHPYLPLAGGTMSGTITGKTITATSLGIGSINIPATDTANQAKFLRGDGTWQTVITTHQSLANYVPTSRTVNGKALSANISLTAADVGASATNHNHSGVYSPTNHTHVSANITDKMVKTAVGPAGWDVTADRGKVVDVSYMSYWNGAYSTNNASNLTYCKQGAFGTIITKNAGDYSTSGHTHSYLPMTGGTLTGDLGIKHTNAANSVFTLNNNATTDTANSIYARSIKLTAQTNGNAGIYDITHSKWLICCNGTGGITLNGQTQLSIATSTHTGVAVNAVTVSNHAITIQKGFSETKLSISTSTHGGNAVTAVSVSNHAITLTKGSTFSLSNHTHSNYLATNGTAVNSTKWNNYTLATVSTSAPSLTATNTANNNKIWLQYV